MPSRRAVGLLLALLAFCLAASPLDAEKVVFRDGKTVEVPEPPCLSGESVHLVVPGLPGPVAYNRNLVDEARTFHANPQTPVAKLFGPCNVTTGAGAGLAAAGSSSPSAPIGSTPVPLRSYTAPRSSYSGASSSSGSVSSQCAAITKKGTRCSRRAQPGRAYCYQH